MDTSEFSMYDSLMDKHSAKRIKLETAERPLNFAISPDEREIQSVKKTKMSRDPTSHRIIEKRRRDRMNNCLAELSRLIPPSYLKQGQGRIEKTEIIEIASKLIRNLLNLNNFREMVEKELSSDCGGTNSCCQEKFYMGYKECQEEVLRHLIDTEGMDLKDDFFQRITTFLDHSSKKHLRLSTVKTASDIQDVKPNDSLTSETPVSNFSSQSNGIMLQGMGISENNIAMIKQDEHLCTLLKRTEQTSSQTSGYSSIRSQSLSEGSVSCISLQSVQRDTADRNERNGSRGSLYSREENSSEGSNGSKNDYHKSHAYKFKHNITKRFSKERSPWNPKSERSSDSMEDENEQGKRKIVSYSTSSPSTEYSQYLGSENSSTNSCSQKNRIQRYQNDFGKDGRFDSKQVPLPAFVLHPLGTHYVPVTIPPTYFKSVFKDDSKGSTAYHPISIPVNFCGPSVSIHTQEGQLICDSGAPKKERSIENS
ncbi:hairy/enhancer-of-split related with YRPW motif protein-like [Mytilus trossulus]|uniref:hairy/enhancer-of-split related with YRPW motif protein-like n=1 Tax=Mytilus trossulus TaxID=6551 RepID=UPI0030062557